MKGGLDPPHRDIQFGSSMSVSKRRLSPVVEVLVVVAIVAGLFCILSPAIQNARNPKGPHGEVLPSQLPNEANRSFHPSGLSIVAPVNWDQIRDQVPGVQFLCIAARGSPGRRLKSWITIERAPGRPDQVLNEYRKVTFRYEIAYEKLTIERKNTLDDAGTSSWNMYLCYQKQWWLIGYYIADEIDEIPFQIRPFIDTIKLPETNGLVPRLNQGMD
jgi:hypothetical protein